MTNVYVITTVFMTVVGLLLIGAPIINRAMARNDDSDESSNPEAPS